MNEGPMVDFLNPGIEPPNVDRIDGRISEALGLRSVAVSTNIGSFDLIDLKNPPPSAAGQDASKPLNLPAVENRLREIRLFLMMRYYLPFDPAFQISASLQDGDPEDFVRRPLITG
jgi:hypothetical protein